ncbi:Fur family transcriptional regulator [Silvibacterium dinghuense]|uniref:Transcriptional repressor n=1 Tax=Silvibacterium dinghuense TaxID=1560006 RepID=A0A4Q1SEK8_9BACT|nr:transcriptional repressor [Silvibacterium dinghuense]RXS95521.1 transcriptional repressor [Silvibacterium dinghuense]GGH13737.1 transcriptional repressor [Silvibacterium dinghuense]
MATSDTSELLNFCFRSLCEEAGIAVTHQRQVVYEELCAMHGHPSPEEVYGRVRSRIPSISLATVYKTIHLFIESGVFREVSLHHGTLRVETNSRPHHHLVCIQCKAIRDIDAEELGLAPAEGHLPDGFLVQRYAVDVLGLCAECQQPTPQ